MEKKALRAEMRALGAVDPEVAGLVVGHLTGWLAGRLPGTAAAYLAMADEVEVSDLFTRLPGWRWVLPRVESGGALTFRDRDEGWETHVWGMRQPVGSGTEVAIHEIDVFLVPGLAFDRGGGRLGRGRGYYDRILAEKRPDAQTVGVTTEQRIVPDMPLDPHDRRVDWVATESGVRERSPRR
jgi:5-formyltetrahydrofolate cyclo-ligase